MSQDSLHGKWTVSSSDDDDDDQLPPFETSGNSGRANSNHLSSSNQASRQVKPEPTQPLVSQLPVVSEDRESVAVNLSDLVRKSPSLSGKRKKQASDGTGWVLSDSEDDEIEVKNVLRQAKELPTNTKTKTKKVKLESPPSPHGKSYYIESEDIFESHPPLLNDTYRLHLNKVTGLDNTFNSGALHIKDILSPFFGTLKESVQFNYCFDVAWMVEQYPSVFRDRPILIVHGDKREAKARLLQQAQPFPHIHFCQAKLDIAFGTHHTKMMLLWYDEGFRVVILTSNMIRADWYQKTQGMWISPLFPRLPKGGGTSNGESPTFFKKDLLEYLASYRAPELETWIQRIKEHDLSETRVYLVASTPGRYVGVDLERWGHLRLRKLLSDHTNPIPDEEKWPVIGQFSSIGSMGLDKTKWLEGEFQCSLSTLKRSSVHPPPPLHLVYPSVEDVRTSLEGYPAGGSLPYSIQTAQKQLWLHSYFHCWKATATGRSHAMPHIKTYMRASPDFTNLAWFLITSANLSKAAWGALEKNNTQMMIRSYELGVLFVPSAFDMKSFQIDKNPFPVSSSSTGFPVPFDLPPVCYSAKDQPWIWNIPYSHAPDTHGNVWIPS